MRAFTTHTGVAAPLPRSNIDTDQICAAQFLKRITKTGYDDALFAEWRKDPDFVLNLPAYAQASILVVGPSFGTGSSREHAVWALRDYGIRAIVGSSFADIFSGNSGKQGLLLVRLPEPEVIRLLGALAAEPGSEMMVDLERQRVTLGEDEWPFEVDPHTRERLLRGLDDIDLTLQHVEEIERFESSRPSWKPRIQLL